MDDLAAQPPPVGSVGSADTLQPPARGRVRWNRLCVSSLCFV